MHEKTVLERPIEVSRSGGVLTITLNSPDTLNAVDHAMAAEMRRVGEHLRRDTESRAIVLKGNGPAFMAGADLRAFEAQKNRMPDFIAEIMGGFHSFVAALNDAPQPTIAAIHGSAAGGGLSLALVCDFVLAAHDTKLSFAYRALGTSPDGGSTHVLPRIVGPKRALDLLLLSSRISTDDALRLGLISRLVPGEELEKETSRIVEALLRNSSGANARTKALVKASASRDLAEQLAEEQKAFTACAVEPDFMEGVNAFLGKRKPDFSG